MVDWINGGGGGSVGHLITFCPMLGFQGDVYVLLTWCELISGVTRGQGVKFVKGAQNDEERGSKTRKNPCDWWRVGRWLKKSHQKFWGISIDVFLMEENISGISPGRSQDTLPPGAGTPSYAIENNADEISRAYNKTGSKHRPIACRNINIPCIHIERLAVLKALGSKASKRPSLKESNH